MLMFLGVCAFVVLVAAIMNTARVHQKLAIVRTKAHFPTAVTIFVLVAHISELRFAIAHASIVELLVTLSVFVLWVGASSGSEHL